MKKNFKLKMPSEQPMEETYSEKDPSQYNWLKLNMDHLTLIKSRIIIPIKDAFGALLRVI